MTATAKVTTKMPRAKVKVTRQDRVIGYKKGGKNMLYKENSRRGQDGRMHDSGAFMFIGKSMNDRLAVMLTDGSRDAMQVGAAARKGLNLWNAAKRAGVPSRVATNHARRVAWEALLGDKDAEPELSNTRVRSYKPQADRTAEAKLTPRQEIKKLIDETLAAMPKTKRKIQTAMLWNIRTRKRELTTVSTTVPLERPVINNLGDFVKRFPHLQDAVVHLWKQAKG